MTNRCKLEIILTQETFSAILERALLWSLSERTYAKFDIKMELSITYDAQSIRMESKTASLFTWKKTLVGDGFAMLLVELNIGRQTQNDLNKDGVEKIYHRLFRVYDKETKHKECLKK